MTRTSIVFLMFVCPCFAETPSAIQHSQRVNSQLTGDSLGQTGQFEIHRDLVRKLEELDRETHLLSERAGRIALAASAAAKQLHSLGVQTNNTDLNKAGSKKKKHCIMLSNLHLAGSKTIQERGGLIGIGFDANNRWYSFVMWPEWSEGNINTILPHLGKLDNLEMLILNNNCVTDENLVSISNLDNLRYLFIKRVLHTF